MASLTARSPGPPRRQHPHELDMYVAEYASRPIFWVIAILMFASWFIMIDPVDKPPQKNQAEAEAEAESPEPPPPNSSNKEALTIKPQLTRRLLPYITSRPRKVFILLACLTMLSLGLLEGYWDVVTAWRFGVSFLHRWPVWSAPLWIHGMFLVSAAFCLMVIMVLLLMVAMTLVLQLGYTCEIAANSPVEHQQRLASPLQSASTDVEMGSSAHQDGAASSRESLGLEFPSSQLPPATTNTTITTIVTTITTITTR